jgi:Uma2 family endonuclease
MNDINRYPQVPVLPPSRRGEPTWEVARFFPVQGKWTEEEYLALPTNNLVELSNGCLEFLPMPTHYHQAVVLYLYRLLYAFTTAHAPGTVMVASLPVHLGKGLFREPDVLYMRAENADRINDYWEGADLVMEVVSPSNSDHDRRTKRAEYAQARIPEYWIVDVVAGHILVLALRGRRYRVHGRFGPGTQATSALLQGFTVDVDEVLALARPANR